MALASKLRKMTGKDKDYRYIAPCDLLNELSKEGFEADADLEIKLSNIILQQLDDAAGDVSQLAVKCPAPLVKKASVARVLEMTNKLCDKLLNGKDQNRAVTSVALKTIVSQMITSTAARGVLVCLTPQLLSGIKGDFMRFVESRFSQSLRRQMSDASKLVNAG